MENILSITEELGKGDYAIGTVRSFEAGIIDIPFAPSKYNMGKVMPVRDNNGAVRFLDYGNIPLIPDSSYIPTKRSQYCQSNMVFSKE